MSVVVVAVVVVVVPSHYCWILKLKFVFFKTSSLLNCYRLSVTGSARSRSERVEQTISDSNLGCLRLGLGRTSEIKKAASIPN